MHSPELPQITRNLSRYRSISFSSIICATARCRSWAEIQNLSESIKLVVIFITCDSYILIIRNHVRSYMIRMISLPLIFDIDDAAPEAAQAGMRTPEGFQADESSKAARDALRLGDRTPLLISLGKNSNRTSLRSRSRGEEVGDQIESLRPPFRVASTSNSSGSAIPKLGRQYGIFCSKEPPQVAPYLAQVRTLRSNLFPSDLQMLVRGTWEVSGIPASKLEPQEWPLCADLSPSVAGV